MVNVAPQSSVRPSAIGGQAGSTPFILAPGADEGGTLGPDMLVRAGPEGAQVLPVVHPDRQRPKYQFVKAINHFRDAAKDKNEIQHLISVFDALPWCDVNDAARAFLTSERGRGIWLDEPHLPDVLEDHASLRRTPAGSFAHAYCDFMEREGLSATAMVAASGDTRNGQPMLPDGVEWYGDRFRDTHDIVHVLTGYGRDPLGEQCVMVYPFHKRPSLGHLMVGWVSAMMMFVKDRSGAPIVRTLLEAHRHGRLAPQLVEQPITQLLPLPLTEVRRRLNVRQPVQYEAALRIWAERGIDPHDFFAKPA